MVDVQNNLKNNKMIIKNIYLLGKGVNILLLVNVYLPWDKENIFPFLNPGYKQLRCSKKKYIYFSIFF
jgi:hypothetical protein